MEQADAPPQPDPAPPSSPELPARRRGPLSAKHRRDARTIASESEPRRQGRRDESPEPFTVIRGGEQADSEDAAQEALERELSPAMLNLKITRRLLDLLANGSDSASVASAKELRDLQKEIVPVSKKDVVVSFQAG